MKLLLFSLALFSGLYFFAPIKKPKKVFDVHIHGSQDPLLQIQILKKSGVYKTALSTSWNQQNNYRDLQNTEILYGLMLPCPNGKVPYSLQQCFPGGEEWPDISWAEQQIKEGKVNFLGEVLSQYYGISSSDSLLFPYYSLANKYNLPVGLHTGGAGPDHGCPNFKLEMGNPLLLKSMLSAFPDMKIWIMHSGDQYYKEAIDIMLKNVNVYSDISVISNPEIVSSERFSKIMKAFLDAGLEDRLMFGTDNGNIEDVIASVEALGFITKSQKKKLYYQNAERFFNTRRIR